MNCKFTACNVDVADVTFLKPTATISFFNLQELDNKTKTWAMLICFALQIMLSVNCNPILIIYIKFCSDIY